jgi:TFIIB zinc-binding.
MTNITYKCPACGGALRFNPPDGKFTCEYCGSVYNEVDIKEKESARQTENEAEGTTLYTCPSCGAELVTDATTAATECYYCHNPVVLTGRLSKEWKPDCVLPFTVDRETAKSELYHWIKKHRYVPSEFKNEKNLDTITGVYYPYWLADYSANAEYEGEGVKVSTRSTPSYDITTRRYYHVVRRGMIEYKNVQRTALGKADRKLADGVHPYRYDKLEDFKDSYLSGFMAEKRDIEKGDIRESVENECKGYTKDLLTRDCGYSSLTGEAQTQFVGSNYRYALLPAWIMTYKRKGEDKTYYYAMNGQTKNVCGILPVDKNKLMLHCGIIGGIVALLLGLGGYFLW